MKAIDVLMEEHRVIERVLNALDRAVTRLEHGQAIRTAFFLDAAEFFAGFADGCHHRKEEGVLFEEMAASGMPTSMGPIGVMLSEHEEGRRLTRGIRDAAASLDHGSEDPEQVRRRLAGYARRYIALLRDHIAKEDQVLFPMAGELLPKERQDALLTGFAKVEHAEAGEGAHSKYLALAERLERDAGTRD